MSRKIGRGRVGLGLGSRLSLVSCCQGDEGRFTSAVGVGGSFWIDDSVHSEYQLASFESHWKRKRKLTLGSTHPQSLSSDSQYPSRPALHNLSVLY
jgi:hypothetical protein